MSERGRGALGQARPTLTKKKEQPFQCGETCCVFSGCRMFFRKQSENKTKTNGEMTHEKNQI